MTTKPKHILVVDDEARIRFVLWGTLRKLGEEYEVLLAGDAEEALAIVEETPIDLLISDLRLPGKSGVALTEAFRGR